MKLYFLLDDKSKENLRKAGGKKFEPPERDQDELEDLQEMVKIMEEPPNYTISKQGRE